MLLTKILALIDHVLLPYMNAELVKNASTFSIIKTLKTLFVHVEIYILRFGPGSLTLLRRNIKNQNLNAIPVTGYTDTGYTGYLSIKNTHIFQEHIKVLIV